MISKLLIANRGEIACRVMRTAKRLGIATVAIYSDADAASMHVAEADEAVHVGPAAAAESYLRVDAILDAARQTGADAIHPGYGFLSENPEFVEAVEAAGLIFVGPSASAIRAMGLKDAAKALMEEAGVPVVPGYHGERQEPDFLAQQADEIGYPVLIKARAGGGGKGMRKVDAPKDFAEALASAQREAKASFGDDQVLIEKFITSPRHIEIQVFGDDHGNAVHLFERDCSLQRRHQKVIEEAPAPDMPENVRAAMGEAAVKAAKAIGYSGAGTVEFIVDGSGGLKADGFWFMEMNTRLQVEHPVTEAITGLDLVELQLHVASGAPLPFAQDALSINGHAFEARLYAEDVPKGFLPAIGKLEHLRFSANARNDTGVREGDEVTPFYDPMIAKVIVHGTTREEALGKMRAALHETHIAGTVTNKAFLDALCAHEGFARGEVDTGLIERDLDDLVREGEIPAFVYGVAVAAAMGFVEKAESPDPWAALKGWQLWGRSQTHVTLVHGADTASLDVSLSESGELSVSGEGVDLTMTLPGDGGGKAIVDGRAQEMNFAVSRSGTAVSEVTVFHGGETFVFAVPVASGEEATGAGGDDISAPMPGLVKQLRAKVGDTVHEGDGLVVLEAMKMEHTLTAPRDGVIAAVNCAEGNQVQDGDLLVSLEPETE